MHRNNSKINKIDKGKGMQYLKLIICMTMSLFNECRTGQAERQSSLVQKNFSPNFIFTIDANDREEIQRERDRELPGMRREPKQPDHTFLT